MNIAYCRVSSSDQNLSRQEEALDQYHIERWYKEMVSGKNMNDRSELNKMLDYAREGDIIFVHDLSRLARNTKDLLAIVDLLEKKNVKLVSNKENIESDTPIGKCMLSMIGAIYQLERENILERQKEGIAIAKANGVYARRKRSRKQVDNALFESNYQLWLKHKISKVQFAKNIKVSRVTLDKMIAERMDNE